MVLAGGGNETCNKTCDDQDVLHRLFIYFSDRTAYRINSCLDLLHVSLTHFFQTSDPQSTVPLCQRREKVAIMIGTRFLSASIVVSHSGLGSGDFVVEVVKASA